jgi:hypothetical protein
MNAPPTSGRVGRSQVWFGCGLLLASVIAVVARLYDLSELPTGVFFDEAMNGLDALDTQSQTGIRLWIPDNFSRGLVAEGLLSHLQALSFSWFGVSLFSLRLPSALAGAAAVPFVGLLARELLSSRVAGTVAALFMATGMWPVLLSREAYPASFVPLCIAASLYFFLTGVRHGSTWRMLVGGIALGAGTYTYAAYRVVPLLFIVVAVLLLLCCPWRVVLRGSLITGGTGLCVALPMLWAMWVEPGLLNARAGGLSVVNTEGGAAAILSELARTTGLALIKYNGPGDEKWIYNIAGQSLLDPVSGALFLIGVVTLIVWFVRGIRRTRTGEPRVMAMFAAITISGFVITLLPEILANEGNPHALRSIGSQVFVFTIAAAPVAVIARLTAQKGLGFRIGAGVVITTLVLTSTLISGQRLFVDYRTSMGHHVNTQTYLRTIGEYLASEPPSEPFAIVGLSMYDEAVIRFLAPEASRRVTFASDPTQAVGFTTVIVRVSDPAVEAIIAQKRFPKDRRIIDLRPGTGSEFLLLRF